MSKESNREYYTARVQAERALAAKALDATSAARHSEMADRYAELLAQLDEAPMSSSPSASRG